MKDLANRARLPGVQITKHADGSLQWHGSPNGSTRMPAYVHVVRYAKNRHYYISFSEDGKEYTPLKQVTRGVAMAALWLFCANDRQHI